MTLQEYKDFLESQIALLQDACNYYEYKEDAQRFVIANAKLEKAEHLYHMFLHVYNHYEEKGA